MVFNTYTFLLLFLPVFVVLYWLLPTHRRTVREAALLIGNVIFYLYAGLDNSLLLATMMLITFSAAPLAASDQPGRRNLGLMLGLSSLIPLLYFKYSENLSGIFTPDSATGTLLPLGISFYTFNLLSYTLDVYSRRIAPEKSLVRFATFASFFPTIGSGPLLRYKHFSTELASDQPVGRDDVNLGFYLIVLGLSKKLIIADLLAQTINPLFTNYTELGFFGAWVAVIGFTFQLYYDFSGYTDIAIGIGHLLGMQLPQNFNNPYRARNISEFWQRWHITLSFWFRDYVFMPLSRFLLRRYPNFNTLSLRSTSLIITMILTGMWHGSTAMFALWGLYHGILQALFALIRPVRIRRWPNWASEIVTLIAVMFGWMIFRSTSLDMAGHIFTSMIGAHGFDRLAVPLVVYLIIGSLLILTFALPRDASKAQPRFNFATAVALSILMLICFLALDSSSPFVYVQF